MSQIEAEIAPAQSFQLAGPSGQGDAASLPVRGDLAHIALAGKVFVPHYAVPMPHAAQEATIIRAAGNAEADRIAELSNGASFDVLDMSGGWAWGMAVDGAIGYVPLAALTAKA